MVPTRDHTAATVTQVLLERVVGYFGTPQALLSDNGPEFVGHLWTKLLQQLRVKAVKTSPYHPQGNGINERSHRTCHNILRSFMVERGTQKWVQLVPETMLAMNALPRSGHHLSASQVALGQTLQLPRTPLTPQAPVQTSRRSYEAVSYTHLTLPTKA